MNAVLRRGMLAGLIVAVGAQLVRPARTNPPYDPAASLGAAVQVPPRVSAVLERACRDCHSNETRWPWYSNVAPVSWWVIDHVNHGRSHFNYSEWSAYEEDVKRKLLEGTCQLARRAEMPMPAYARMHADARLSPGDIDALCEWAIQRQGPASGDLQREGASHE